MPFVMRNKITKIEIWFASTGVGVGVVLLGFEANRTEVMGFRYFWVYQNHHVGLDKKADKPLLTPFARQAMG